MENQNDYFEGPFGKSLKGNSLQTMKTIYSVFSKAVSVFPDDLLLEM